MAESTIQKFKSTLIGGGARPNLFEVRIPGAIPGGGTLGDDFSILCKAAQLPASNIASIDVPFRGRIFKVAGDRTFDTWTITIINDENFSIRRVMEDWMNFIGQYGDASGATEPGSYMVDAYVKQLTRSASNIRNTGEGGGEGQGLSLTSQTNPTETIYKFHSIFPTALSAIDLSYESTDTIEEFTAEFQVQYWTPAAKGEIGE
jgi:hypothetical protein